MLAVTGDIAYSGTEDQYSLAASFFSSIKTELQTSDSLVVQFFIPGNHDLDFRDQPDTREALLQHVKKNPGKIDPAGETAKQILSVQKHFFEFESTMLESSPRPEAERLSYGHTFDVAGSKVRVSCYNTAWVPKPLGWFSLKTMEDEISHLLSRAEAKFCTPNGSTCTSKTIGLLVRRHIHCWGVSLHRQGSINALGQRA